MVNIAALIQKIVRHELEKIRIGELGVVTSVFPHAAANDDNNYECNVRLKNSAVNGSDLELRKVPIAAGVIGSAMMPNVGDLVLISFVRGDVNQPIIAGRLYNDEDRPPIHQANEIMHRLPLAAEDEQTIIFALRNIPDNTPPRELNLEMPDKIKFQITDSRILAQVDKTQITIEQPGTDDGVITVESGKSKVTINQDGDLAVEAEGAMSLTAKGDMLLQAPNISLTSDQAINIEAGTDGVFKTGAQINIESGAPMQIKSGATAQIEAAATMNLKGAVININ